MEPLEGIKKIYDIIEGEYPEGEDIDYDEGITKIFQICEEVIFQKEGK